MDMSALEKVNFLLGDTALIAGLPEIPARAPFDDEVINFFDEASRAIRAVPGVREHPDVMTYGFWIRRASLLELKKRFLTPEPGQVRLGRGVAFHIAPSNVPVNFAYSLAAGLLLGNANIVRVPTGDFAEVSMIADAFSRALETHPAMRPYVLLVRYGHEPSVNDLFSMLCDTRIVWGGDKTIAALRRSPLKPRAVEVAFADRFSLAVIDSDIYMAGGDYLRAASDFYNDTFLTDQNACTSPRVVIWTGSRINEAKEIFWHELHDLALSRYTLLAVQSVGKLASAYLAAASLAGSYIEPHDDNVIIRVHVPRLDRKLIDLRDNSGFFFEYECPDSDLTALLPLVGDRRCQTISYIGDPEMFSPLIALAPGGIDRIVPIGHSMDFDLIWDGYDLTSFITRVVAVR